MSKTPQNLSVCPRCNYDLRGSFSENQPSPICPECGTPLQRAKPDSIITREKMHRRFRGELLYPTCVVPVLITPLVFISWTAEVAAGIFALVCGFGYPIMYIAAVESLIRGTKRHPRPAPRWLIPIIGLGYFTPGAILSIGLVFLIDRYALPYP